VTPAELEQLRSPEGRALLDEVTPYNPSEVLASAERLRTHYDTDLVTVAMTQARLRTKAAERFGDRAFTLWWTPDSLEQATRPEVSARRARRLVDAGATYVADLGCGAGLDTLAMADAGLKVLAVEREPTLAEVASANAEEAGLADRIEVRCADALTVDLAAEGCDAVFVDPARRKGGRRILEPEHWSPRFSVAVDLAQRVPRGVLKVAPGLDRSLVPDDAVFEAVSADGTLVEVALWFGMPEGEVRRRAVVLPAGATLDNTAPRPPRTPVGAWGSWVVEPDDAVIRSGLVAQLAAGINGRLIDPQIAYVTCDDEPPADPLYARFAIDEVIPFSMKVLRTALRDRSIGRLEVKKRGFAMDPDEVRRGLKLDRRAPGSCTVLLTRVGDAPVAAIAHRP
jgi:hypothetical protein